MSKPTSPFAPYARLCAQLADNEAAAIREEPSGANLGMSWIEPCLSNTAVTPAI